MKLSLFISFYFLSMFFLVPPIYAIQSITLAWDKPTEGGKPDGYKLYYRKNKSGPPWDGTGAIEGPSPINVGVVTQFTVHGLEDNAAYYFIVTAYNKSGEGPVSNGAYKLSDINNDVHSLQARLEKFESLLSPKKAEEILSIQKMMDEVSERKKFEKRIEKKLLEYQNKANKLDDKLDSLNFRIWGILITIISSLVGAIIFLGKRLITIFLSSKEFERPKSVPDSEKK